MHIDRRTFLALAGTSFLLPDAALGAHAASAGPVLLQVLGTEGLEDAPDVVRASLTLDYGDVAHVAWAYQAAPCPSAGAPIALQTGGARVVLSSTVQTLAGPREAIRSLDGLRLGQHRIALGGGAFLRIDLGVQQAEDAETAPARSLA